MVRTTARLLALTALMLWSSLTTQAETKTLARCGKGFLEEVDGYRVLHIKGGLGRKRDDASLA